MMEEELKVDINEELIEDELQSLSDGNSELSEGDQRLTQRSFENAFICSNRLSKDRSLRGTLNRSEWINFILRLIQYRYGLRVGKDKRWAKTSDYLKDFIHDFFNSEYQKSEIFAVRKVIRESTTLNQFLIDNKKILTAIFDHCKEKEDQCHNNYHDHSNKGDCKKFDRGSAIYLLYQHLHPIYLNV